MSGELKQIAEQIATSPKSSVFAVFATQFSAWWIEWGSPLIDAASSILGIVLLIALIRYHWKKGSDI